MANTFQGFWWKAAMCMATNPLSEKDTAELEANTSEHAKPIFEKLFEFSPDAIIVTDANGLILQANPQTEHLFGYSRKELQGNIIEILVPQRFRQTHPKHREGYYASSHIRPMGAGLELFARRKDGSEFPVDIMLSPVATDGGRVVLTVVRDISARRQTEDALRKSEERFRLLVDGARDYAIFMLDVEGKVITWNPGAERIKGYRAEEIIGQHFSLFYIQDDLDRNKPSRELEVASTEGRYEDEGWRVRKDGSRFWANVIITALRGKDGRIIGFSKVTRDFTNRRKAEEALLLELSKAVLSSLDIRQMLSAIAASIQHLLPNDYATIALYDNNTDRLRVRELASLPEAGPSKEFVLEIEGTPAGFAFKNRQALFMDHIDTKRFAPEGLTHLIQAGVKSGCWLPLNSHGHIIGTLFVGSRRESAFNPEDTEMLLQMASQIAVAVDNVYAFRQISELSDKLKEEKRYLEEELRTEYSFEEIVGASSSLKRVLKQVETVAPTDATVLVLGETGTGKELIARAIHHLSPRCEQTFVKLNCSAIPLGLLESELFGHEKGAFTGAITQRIGRLELAHMGTLFLDEIGDLPLELQPKILRALQEKEIERLGGKRTIPVDVRLIAATNRDLAQMVKAGQFRSDLYYRLKVFPLLIPPLRERREDIPLLVNYFVAKHARRMKKHIETISADVMAALTRWQWPGNVRELENFLERAVILTQGSTLRAPLTELDIPDEPADLVTNPNLRTAEREHILRVLREANGMIGGPGGAAEKLGLKRTTLNSKLRKLGIQREEYI
jgi:formate hydrogenlyase transcriptional activator